MLGKQVALLMMELQLQVRQADKVLSLITYLHNQCVNGTNVNMKLLKFGKHREKEQKELKVSLCNYSVMDYIVVVCEDRLPLK